MRLPRTVLTVSLITAMATSANAQTIRSAIAPAATAAAMQATRTELNKPLWYGGAAVLGGGIGLVIGSAFSSGQCNDYRGFGLAGALYEDDCNNSKRTQMFGGIALASGGALMMLLARPKVVQAAPSIHVQRGRTTVLKTVRF